MTRRSPAAKPGLAESRESQANDLPSIRAVGDTSENPPEQTPLFDVPRARGHWTDGHLVADGPESKAAAESISLVSVTYTQRIVLNAARLHRGGFRLEDLPSIVHKHFPSCRSSSSSLRSRAKELERRGDLVVVGFGETSRGRRCKLLAAKRAD
jgi:hypothetical protein